MLRPWQRLELLLVSEAVLVQVVGVPVACATGTRDAWREAASLVAHRLARCLDALLMGTNGAG